MGRCKYELLADIEPALNEIRKLQGLTEKKPGIFYFKSQGFMHFHEKNGVIWADIHDGKAWGTPIILPTKVTKAFNKQLSQSVYNRLLSSKKRLNNFS